MRELFTRLWERLPLDFRVLHRQFLLRVIDLESLSIEADIPRFLGQFAGILIMFGLVLGIGVLWTPPPPQLFWGLEQSRIADVLLVVGLCSVLTWDSTFPDRRDVMILGPLPMQPRTILSAKVAASGTLLGIAVIALNFGSSLGCSLVLGGVHGSVVGIVRFFFAYWFTVFAAGAFLYGAVLTIQGFTALLLPRRMFLRVSALLQLAAFGFFLGARFLQPTLSTPAEILAPANRMLLAGSPTLWFFALLNQLNGSLPRDLQWLALRAWVALLIVATGAVASLLLSYLRTMKKTVEEPDLVPGARGFHWTPRFGNSLQSAIVLFCFRSILRSRQHRLALAFYWSIVLAVALSWARRAITTPPEPIGDDFLMSTFLMMCFAVLGLRSLFALPISLHANWMLRVTQLRPTKHYIAATRRCLLLFGVAPIWAIVAALTFHFRPWQPAAEHLAFLPVLGWVLVELSLIKFDRVPFTCSYMPGKTNIQAIFWGFLFIFLTVGLALGIYEHDALEHTGQYALMMILSAATITALWSFNRAHAKTAELYFEEIPEELLTKLGIANIQLARNGPGESAAK